MNVRFGGEDVLWYRQTNQYERETKSNNYMNECSEQQIAYGGKALKPSTH